MPADLCRPDLIGEPRDGRLRVGHCCYDVVILPGLKTIRSTTLDVLESFGESGGKVVVAGSAPGLVDSVQSSRAQSMKATYVPFNKTAILKELDCVRDVRATLASGTAADSLLYQMRIDGDDRYMFVCNTDRDFSRQTHLEVRGEWTVTLLDTMSGDESRIRSSTRTRGTGVWTAFPHHFHGCGSILLRLQPPSAQDNAPSLPVFDEPAWKVVDELQLASVSLSEPNVLLLDMARHRVDDEQAWSGKEEILRTDNIARQRVGLPLRQDNLAQPYRLPKTRPEHTIHLQFEFDCLVSNPVTDAQIALEGLSDTTITLDGHVVSSAATGWWVDKSIATCSLPPIHGGKHILELSVPFGVRTNIERAYIIGTFGVDLRGREATIVDLNLDRIRIGDYTSQGLPFYAGDVRYEFAPVNGQDRTAVQLPRFASPVLRVEAAHGRKDTRHLGKIAFPPYVVDLGHVPAQEEDGLTISVTAVGNRNNAFGALHLPDGLTKWYGPDSYRTNGDKWTYEYNIQEMGLLAAPRLLTADAARASKTWDAGSVHQDLWFH